MHSVDIVLLDYHSNDGLYDYIILNFMNELNSGKLKYFRLISEASYFDMSYAKNIVHCLASGDTLFNLDADNYIGTTLSELQQLAENSILLPKMVANTQTGRCGRIGISKILFHKLRGYNEGIKGLNDDDGDFIRRALDDKIQLTFSQDLSVPVPNSHDEKYRYSDPSIKLEQIKLSAINPSGYGLARVCNIDGEIIDCGLSI